MAATAVSPVGRRFERPVKCGDRVVEAIEVEEPGPRVAARAGAYAASMTSAASTARTAPSKSPPEATANARQVRPEKLLPVQRLRLRVGGGRGLGESVRVVRQPEAPAQRPGIRELPRRAVEFLEVLGKLGLVTVEADRNRGVDALGAAEERKRKQRGGERAQGRPSCPFQGGRHRIANRGTTVCGPPKPGT